ncbi:hypothetical protein FIBSPDRAFT_859012 [Athelia psychrophila]|uniref:Uncharacterized protein n=1 Tax=Athelia psychrophila TaxID=1759441 RepID=A0A166LKU2_9AGAM|nr:hypothetical protein FIBSPDRAFT_859012 [Fibularhizoctonia sp. CBS 109695]
MWALVPFYAIWGAIIYALSVYVSTGVSKSGHIQSVGIGSEKLPDFSWAISPNNNTQSFGIAYLTNHAKESAILPSATWPSILLVFMAIQCGLTLVLHYCEAIINTTQDEHVWRQAMGEKGVSIFEDKSFRAHIASQLILRKVFLWVTKTVCQWLFDQSFQVTGVFAQLPQVTSGEITGSYFIGIELIAHCAQLWYLSAALVGFAIITTIIANHEPSGPLPAAYGHFQTLANLIIDECPIPGDEKSNPSHQWPPVLYWGHKAGPDKDGICHAGVSSAKSLVHEIHKERLYGGESDPKWPSAAKKEDV